MNELKDLQGDFTAKYNSQAIAKLNFKQARHMQKSAKVYCKKGKNMVYCIRQYRQANKNIYFRRI